MTDSTASHIIRTATQEGNRHHKEVNKSAKKSICCVDKMEMF
jgi:hypothetical protein